MERRHYDLLLDVRRSARYHERRRRFYEGREKLSKVLALIIGPLALTVLPGGVNVSFSIVVFTSVSMLITSFAIWNLITDTVKMAQVHSDLARRFVDLREQMAARGQNPTDNELNEFTAKRLRIEIDEPPKLRVFDILCLNEIILSEGHDRGELWDVPWAKSVLARFFDVDDTKIVQVKTKRAKRGWFWFLKQSV